MRTRKSEKSMDCIKVNKDTQFSATGRPWKIISHTKSEISFDLIINIGANDYKDVRHESFTC